MSVAPGNEFQSPLVLNSHHRSQSTRQLQLLRFTKRLAKKGTLDIWALNDFLFFSHCGPLNLLVEILFFFLFVSSNNPSGFWNTKLTIRLMKSRLTWCIYIQWRLVFLFCLFFCILGTILSEHLSIFEKETTKIADQTSERRCLQHNHSSTSATASISAHQHLWITQLLYDVWIEYNLR